MWAVRRRKQRQEEKSLLSDVLSFRWRRDNKQAADDDALLSGAHSVITMEALH